MNLIELIAYIVDIIKRLISSVEQATDYIDSINFYTLPLFEETQLIFGQIHWLLSTPVYTTFILILGTGVILTMWRLAVEAIGWIRQAFFI